MLPPVEVLVMVTGWPVQTVSGAVKLATWAARSGVIRVSVRIPARIVTGNRNGFIRGIMADDYPVNIVRKIE